MSYTNDKIEVALGSGQVVTSTGTVGSWMPGFQPHVIRAASAIITAATTSGAVVKVLSGTIGLTGSLTTVATLNLTTGAATDTSVIFSDQLDVQVDPGEEVQFRVTETGAGANFTPVLYMQPTWEMPANLSSMASSTATS